MTKSIYSLLAKEQKTWSTAVVATMSEGLQSTTMHVVPAWSRKHCFCFNQKTIYQHQHALAMLRKMHGKDGSSFTDK